MPDSHAERGNLLERLTASNQSEVFETLASGAGVRVERIVSTGQSSPEEGWYDQANDEWVAVLRGAAVIAYPDGKAVAMGEGDWLHLPAHTRHRVQWTDPNRPTVWLAVHFPPEPGK
jgi:cupin 2 domain-containing protein